MAKRKIKEFWDMTAAERVEATKQFDKPIPESRVRPLSARERRKFERALADKPHVSIYVSAGRRDIKIHLDDDLQAKVRVYARKHKTSLRKMIDRGLRGLIAFGEI
jgi:hypothetical protein